MVKESTTDVKSTAKWKLMGFVPLVPPAVLTLALKYGVGMHWGYAVLAGVALTAIGYVSFLKNMFSTKD